MSVVTWEPGPTLRRFQWSRLVRMLALCLAVSIAVAALAVAGDEVPSTRDTHLQQGVVAITEGRVIVNGGGALCAAPSGGRSYELQPEAKARYGALTRNGGWQRYSAGTAELAACGTVADVRVPLGALPPSGRVSTKGRGSARLLSAFGPGLDVAEVTSLRWVRSPGGAYILKGSYRLRTAVAHPSFRTGRLTGVAMANPEAHGRGLALPAQAVGMEAHDVRALVHYRSRRA